MHRKYKAYSDWKELDKPNPEFTYEKEMTFDSGKLFAEAADRLFAREIDTRQKDGTILRETGLLNEDANLKVEVNAMYLDHPREWNQEYEDYKKQMQAANAAAAQSGTTPYPVYDNVTDWMEARLNGYQKYTQKLEPGGGTRSGGSGAGAKDINEIFKTHYFQGKIFPGPGGVVDNTNAYLLTNCTVDDWGTGAKVHYQGNSFYIPELGKSITLKTGATPEILSSSVISTDTEGFNWVTTTMAIDENMIDPTILKELQNAGLLTEVAHGAQGSSGVTLPSGAVTGGSATPATKKYNISATVPLRVDETSIIRYSKHAGQTGESLDDAIASAYMNMYDSYAYMDNAKEASYQWTDGKTYTGQELIDGKMLNETELINTYKNTYLAGVYEPQGSFPTRQKPQPQQQQGSVPKGSTKWGAQGTQKKMNETSFWDTVIEQLDLEGIPYNPNDLRTKHSTAWDLYNQTGDFNTVLDNLRQALGVK